MIKEKEADREGKREEEAAVYCCCGCYGLLPSGKKVELRNKEEGAAAVSKLL